MSGIAHLSVDLSPDGSEKILKEVTGPDLTMANLTDQLAVDGHVSKAEYNREAPGDVAALSMEMPGSLSFELDIGACCEDDFIDFLFSLDDSEKSCQDVYTSQEVADRILEIVHEEMDDKDSSAELIGLLMNEFGSDDEVSN